jgi:hypothetical protein
MESLHEPRYKLIAEAARELRKGDRWLRDWLKYHPCDRNGEPFYRLAPADAADSAELAPWSAAWFLAP